MFELLKSYDIILVTGPQRSGTTICAQMIAHDLEKGYVDEQEFNVHNFEKFCSFLDLKSNIVVQCPSMSRYCHLFSHHPSLAVVFIIRPVAEIIASQERIKWRSNELREFQKYGYQDGLDKPISQLKYEVWHTFQKDHIENKFEIKYESLKSHPMWIPKDKRNGFEPRQTTL